MLKLLITTSLSLFLLLTPPLLNAANIDLDAQVDLARPLESKDWTAIRKIINNINVKTNPKIIEFITRSIFINQPSQVHYALQILFISKANYQQLPPFLFSQPLTKERAQLLKQVIRNGIAHPVGHNIAFKFVPTFSQPATPVMKDLLKYFIEVASPWELQTLGLFAFSHANSASMTDLLKLFIEKADSYALSNLNQRSFLLPHTQSPEFAILRQSLTMTNPRERIRWLQDHYTPHAAKSVGSCHQALD